MSADFYTLAAWRIKEGQEREFLRVWKEELAPAFLSVSPDAQGTLVQSLDDPACSTRSAPGRASKPCKRPVPTPKRGKLSAN